ncbi:Protein ZBED8 [Thelohanellus kitauei]|uniref:Protein ZBED8 n=1 Tax=Thelohanellus kitauei TaxID=669202 RepID=A0A0C2MJ65_THEKT|nr:Protein ZBED8 [Thelohanellus kitauei]
MIGQEFVNKLNRKCISNDREHRKIADTSEDILDQIMQEIKSCPLPIFSIQIDESTGVLNCSQLIVNERYIYYDFLKDQFLLCPLPETTTVARYIFEKIGLFLEI